MTSKRTATQQRADDELWVIWSLVNIFRDVRAEPLQAGVNNLHGMVFTLGLSADQIERMYRRVVRRNAFLSTGRHSGAAWAAFLETLDQGRKLVAEHKERERQRRNGGAV
jgi:hypothetical protein